MRRVIVVLPLVDNGQNKNVLHPSSVPIFCAMQKGVGNEVGKKDTSKFSKNQIVP